MNHPDPGRHDASHDHGAGHGHEHEHGAPGLGTRLRHVLRPHSHEPADQVDAVMEGSAEGMRTLWITLAVLGLTALVQAVVTGLSGSVALLSDTLHNAADALTAVPLGGAFGGGPPSNRGACATGWPGGGGVRGGAPPPDPPLHLWVRPGRGSGGDRDRADDRGVVGAGRSEEHTSELK